MPRTCFKCAPPCLSYSYVGIGSFARAGFSKTIVNTAQQRPCLTFWLFQNMSMLRMGIPNMTELCELHYAKMTTCNLTTCIEHVLCRHQPDRLVHCLSPPLGALSQRHR